MVVAFQIVGVAGVPLKVNVLVPCAAPKFAPEIVTEEPTVPDVGFRLEMFGGIITVKLEPLLATPPAATTTLPVVARAGTKTVMLVALHAMGIPAVPLNVTELVPCAEPKFAPAIVTDVPIKPEVGFKLMTLGAGTITVKLAPMLATPPTVTATLPVVAPAGTAAVILVSLQLVGVAVVPLKVTALAPCAAPKLVPEIVTAIPLMPELGFRLVILGADVVLLTLTMTVVLVATFPEVSVATALKL
jgi:hypothetical protein